MFREIAISYRRAESGKLRRRILAVYLFLAGLNVAAWALASAMFYAYPAALSLCFLAYGLGLRHAVNADHIAAIDNVTRKLMQQGQKPVCVGFFFSLGHSTVVVLMSLLVAQGTGYVRTHFPQFQQVGGIIGSSVSAFFLLLIAAVNFFIFLDVFGGSTRPEKADTPRTKPSATCRRPGIAGLGASRFLPVRRP